MRRVLFRTRPDLKTLRRFFYKQDWDYASEHEPTAGDTKPFCISWTTGDSDEREVQYVDDKTVDEQYFVITSRSSGDEQEIEDEIRGGISDLLTEEGILAAFESARTTDALLRAFAKVVLIAPEAHDTQFEQYFRRVLKDDDAKVRAEGLGLITYVGWPELKPLIEELEKDSDDAVRKNARIVLDGYKELGIA